MASTWLYLIRHGEVEGAAEGRFFGHTDVALSAVGRRQMDAVAAALASAPLAAVYASDLRRALESAGPLARARGLAVVPEPALREIAMGRWEGLTFREIQALDGERLRAWLADPAGVRFPGGEHLGDLRDRVLPAVQAILARHAGGCVAVVAHGGPNRVVLAEALGLPLGHALRLAQDYACVNLVEYRAGSAVLHLLNRRLDGLPAALPAERTVTG